MIELRAHHLLCIRGFQGLGYDKAFVENFARVVKALEDDPSIVVTAREDVICARCPHNLDGCIKGPKAQELDERVLRELGFRADAVGKASAVLRRVEERIPPRRVTEVCRGCEWHRYCAPKF